jgi:anti-sigma factor RsiW
MHCHEVEPLLVAWHDGELSPSAATQVEEHVAHCPHCVRRSQRLLDTTPTPWASPPADVQARLHAAVDVDLVLAEAERRGPPAPAWRAPRWLTEPREVSPVAVIAYAALLALSLGWGWSNWARLPSGASAPDLAGAQPAAIRVDVIPADAYAPASYHPPESWEKPDDGAMKP